MAFNGSLIRRKFVLTAAALSLPGLGIAQTFSKPIRIISPSAPGGPTDTIARILAERLAPALQVPVIVENKPGAVGVIALDAVAKAPPDGQTLLIGFSSANVIYPLLAPKIPFDARKDFTPISQVMSGGINFMAHPSLPVANLQQFIAYAKTQAAPVSYGSFGSGSTAHLAGEYLQSLVGIKLSHVPYKSASALANDLVAGHIQVGFLDTTNAAALVRSGRLRALAQTGTVRAVALHDIPTMQEQGVPFTAGAWNGVFGPANMSPALVQRLNREIVAALRAPELQERWIAAIGYPPAPTTPAEFDRIIKADFELWQMVIDSGKIRLEP